MSLVLRSAFNIAAKHRFQSRLGPSTSSYYFVKTSVDRHANGFVVFFRGYCSRYESVLNSKLFVFRKNDDDPKVDDVMSDEPVAITISSEFQPPAKIESPESMTEVPIIALNRHPLFPGSRRLIISKTIDFKILFQLLKTRS